VDQFIIEKGNFGAPFKSWSPQLQNCTTMNVHILSDSQYILQQNEQKEVISAWTKATMEWDCFKKVAN
jgi:hypothetical protein